MESINVKATKYSPKIILDPEKKIFEIEGDSRPENVHSFYYPVVLKLDEILNSIIQTEQQPFDLKANFKLYYFNSSSAKFILDILSIFKSYIEKGLNVKIYWYFNEDDEDIKEAGEELSDMISVQFNYVMVKA